LYGMKVVRSKKAYKRKAKHKGFDYEGLSNQPHYKDVTA
jgi:hypothetical protein